MIRARPRPGRGRHPTGSPQSGSVASAPEAGADADRPAGPAAFRSPRAGRAWGWAGILGVMLAGRAWGGEGTPAGEGAASQGAAAHDDPASEAAPLQQGAASQAATALDAPSLKAPAPLVLTPALAAIARGDLAWWSGDRGGAYAAWRQALALATAPAPAGALVPAAEAPPGDPRARAAEAMARVRLLQLGGSVAPFVHERKLGLALAACPASEPWCGIAEADWELFMPAFTGADPARVPELLAGSPLEGPAAARVAVATGAAFGALPDAALDGMGRGLRATGRARPEAPGTWVLGLGVGGAPGAGVGLTTRFVHPDLAWRGHRLELLGNADTRGGFAAAASLVVHPAAVREASVPAAPGAVAPAAPGTAAPAPTAAPSSGAAPARIAWVFGAGASRAVADRWLDGVATPYALGAARASAAVAPRFGSFAASLGVIGRAEWYDGPALLAGPVASLVVGDTVARVRLSGELDVGAYTHAVVSVDLRGAPDVLGGTLALRVGATYVPTDSPFYRLPTAGGAELLRGLAAGRFRDDTLLSAQAEYRHALWGPLHAAVFVDTAHVQGWHLTGGGGLRLVLPPGRENVTRLDFGAGPEGWGLVAGWGEAF